MAENDCLAKFSGKLFWPRKIRLNFIWFEGRETSSTERNVTQHNSTSETFLVSQPHTSRSRSSTNLMSSISRKTPLDSYILEPEDNFPENIRERTRKGSQNYPQIDKTIKRQEDMEPEIRVRSVLLTRLQKVFLLHSIQDNHPSFCNNEQEVLRNGPLCKTQCQHDVT